MAGSDDAAAISGDHDLHALERGWVQTSGGGLLIRARPLRMAAGEIGTESVRLPVGPWMEIGVSSFRG